MKCFVISPIGEPRSGVRAHADEVFKWIIEPALEPFGIEAIRSDHMQAPGRISAQMYKAIFEYDLCIAILTYANPNVYYELAVAQSASRPVVALIEQGSSLPFDVKDFRTIDYDLSITSYVNRTHIDHLVAYLRHFQSNKWRGDNVFAEYAGEGASEPVVDITPFNIRITSPAAGDSVDVVTVEGTFASLPGEYELRSLRYYPDQHGYVPNGVVAIDHQKRTWKVSRFDVGGVAEEARGIEIALAGQSARILLDYWNDAHAALKHNVDQVRALGGKSVRWLPPIKRWPADLITCDRIEVRRK